MVLQWNIWSKQEKSKQRICFRLFWKKFVCCEMSPLCFFPKTIWRDMLTLNGSNAHIGRPSDVIRRLPHEYNRDRRVQESISETTERNLRVVFRPRKTFHLELARPATARQESWFSPLRIFVSHHPPLSGIFLFSKRRECRLFRNRPP